MSRQSRVTADVTLEAHNMLRDYCKEHERSKGFLLEKMIRQFCVEPDKGSVKPEPKNEMVVIKPSVKRFVPPTHDEVFYYMKGKGVTSDNEAQSFCDFYESNGWKVGKNKMKSWQASVRNWLKGYKKTTTSAIEHKENLDDTSWANNLDSVL